MGAAFSAREIISCRLVETPRKFGGLAEQLEAFPAMAEAFLHSVGEDTRGLTGARNVARVEGWYAGDGWYTDGPEHAFDYYNAWAIHPYLSAWYRLTDRQHSAEAERHTGRLNEFVAGFADFVADDGALLHFGRSLTYRTAALAALWCAVSADSNTSPTIAAGASRKLASSVRSRFVTEGVGVEQPLSLGWYGQHRGSCQSYSGFGSPFLAGIGFLGLALPADHPVWTDSEPEPQPPLDAVSSLPEVGWSLSRADGIFRMANHGSDHCWLSADSGQDPDDPHHAKFSYSSHTAPGTDAAWADNIDGQLALVDQNGLASRRCAIRGFRTDGALSGSVHLPQVNGKNLPGSAVLTLSILHGPHELRCHLVHGSAGYTVREGSFALAGNTPPTQQIQTTSVRLEQGLLRSSLLGIHGWEQAEVARYQGCNALGKHSAAAFLTAPGSSETSCYVALHSLTVERELPKTAAEVVAVKVSGSTVSWRWCDGPSGTIDIADFVPWDGILTQPIVAVTA